MEGTVGIHVKVSKVGRIVLEGLIVGFKKEEIEGKVLRENVFAIGMKEKEEEFE